MFKQYQPSCRSVQLICKEIFELKFELRIEIIFPKKSWRKDQKELRQLLTERAATKPSEFTDTSIGFKFEPFADATEAGYRGNPADVYMRGVFNHESQRNLFLCASAAKTQLGGEDEATHEEVTARVKFCKKLLSTEAKVKRDTMKDVKKFQSIWEVLKTRQPRNVPESTVRSTTRGSIGGETLKTGLGKLTNFT